MSKLLIQACSKSKNSAEGAVPALDLYSGYFFKIIKKAVREGEFDESIDIWILSAEYGLIESQEDIEQYDRRMNTERAAELAPQVSDTFYEKGGDDYDTIIVNVGKDYRDVLPDFDALDDAEVLDIGGEGIGIQGHKLKQVVRSDLDIIRGKPVQEEMA